MSDLDKLLDAVSSISPLVLEGEYVHMKEPWEMILGGLILPLIAQEIPEVLKDKENKKLLDQFTKDKIKAFFSPKAEVITKEVVKTVKVPVNVDADGKPLGKFRRLKDHVSKVRREERKLECSDRDIFIEHWNNTQELVDKKDPICSELAQKASEVTGKQPLSPLQVAGYFSYLCRMGLKEAEQRDAIITRNLKKGVIKITPFYTDKLLDQIGENWVIQRQDEDERAKAHAELRARREAGLVEMAPIRSEMTGVASNARVSTPVKVPFDIKFNL